ncbi:MAG: hypothetical protein LBP53_06100 [Candidatus Peribacteria bacterium]|jgi:hypothetical protein|nr:hypothetical protein [Candidatus Peribacteria bacterium]
MAEKYETQGDKKITEMYSNIDGNPSMTIVNAKKPQPPLNSGKKITTVEKIVLHSTAGN